jgi:putative membrane protein
MSIPRLERARLTVNGPLRRRIDAFVLFPPDPRHAGSEPDYRFTLANERTFLAWIRTALALAAAGLGAFTLLGELPGDELLGIGLLATSFGTSAVSYRRWALAEAAIRRDEPLPRSRLPMALSLTVTMIAVGSAVLVLLAA